MRPPAAHFHLNAIFTLRTYRAAARAFFMGLLGCALLAAAHLAAAALPNRRVVGLHACGWGSNWHAEGGQEHYRWDMLTELNAAYYVDMQANGSVTYAICGTPTSWQQAEYPAMRAAAKQHHVQWTFNVQVHGMTSAALTVFLNDTTMRARAVEGLAQVLHGQQADGLMLDFEGAYEWSPVLAPLLLGWFAQLREGLTAAGLPHATLSLPQGMYKPTFTAFRPHIKELLGIFDTIFLMCYVRPDLAALRAPLHKPAHSLLAVFRG